MVEPAASSQKYKYVAKSIERRSAALASRYDVVMAEGHDKTQQTDGLQRQLRSFLEEAIDQSRYIADSSQRATVRALIEMWASVLYREFDDDTGLATLPALEPNVSEPPEIDLKQLLLLLSAGEVIHQKLIRTLGTDRSAMTEALAQGRFVDCRFQSCDFSGYRVNSEADLVGVAFVSCELAQLRWTGLRAATLLFENISDFEGARFPDSNFSDVGFRDIKCTNGGFENARFVHCLFERSQFIDTDFKGALFSNCGFRDCSFVGCTFEDVQLYDSDLEGTLFAGCDIVDTLFSGCELHGIRLEGRTERRKPRQTILKNVQVASSFGAPTEWLAADIAALNQAFSK